VAIPRTYLTAFALSAAAHSFFLVLPGGWARGGEEQPQNFIFLHLEKSAPAFTAAEQRPPEEPAARGEPAAAEARPVSGEKAPANAQAAVSSRELLSDPQTGKIFSSYFQTVKSRIQVVAERQKHYVVRENGKIEVDFILRRNGRIAALEAHPDSEAAGDPLLVSRALDIIRSSQPFEEFPSSIPAEAISFNITLVFDG